ncbi:MULTISPECIES: hypothetical protein [Bacillaceae]|uniref:Uncharacterized protein n=1 Tax=Evansella alkalicola TaxID=745819 RepID=A0ABS6JNL1_9BACI|nr:MULTISPECIES: hypothetical protein [Bacillaceae]MBU9720148.1 hypothetical protein [Bacillus alkalicola]
MQTLFIEDKRLGIALPKLNKSWELYTIEEQGEILAFWEKQRAKIPDRIKELEKVVSRKTNDMLLENDANKMIDLNNEIVHLASVINDLNIWFRTEPVLTGNEKEDSLKRKHL